MANWKKVIVSGSNAELGEITASSGIKALALPTGGTAGDDVIVVDSAGHFKTRSQSDVASAQTVAKAFATMSINTLLADVGTYSSGISTASYNPDNLTFVQGENITLGISSSAVQNASGQSNFLKIAAQTSSVVGTTNQVTVTDSSNVFTLSTPQDIATTSNVQFAQITASGNITASGTISASIIYGDTLDGLAVTDALAAAIVTQIDNDEIPIALLAQDAVTVNSGTNLSGGGSVTLGGNITLNVDDAFLVNNGNDTTTGTITAAGFNTTGGATSTALSASGGISASNLDIVGDGHFTGDITVDSGNIFGANGFFIEIDQVTVHSGSTIFGSGSTNPTDATHEFTGSVIVTGSLTVNGGTITGDGSGITGLSIGNTDIASLTDAEGIQDFTYNGASAATISVDSGSMVAYYTSSAFAAVSGDITISAGGTAAIQANSVAVGDLAQIGANTILGNNSNSSGDVSAIAVGNAELLIGNGNGFTTNVLSGDVTMDNAGAATIATNAVEFGMLNDNVISGQSGIAELIADADEFLFSNAGALASVSASQLATYVSSSFALDGIFGQDDTNTTYHLHATASTTDDFAIQMTGSDGSVFNIDIDGTANEVDVALNDANNRLTFGLPSNVTIGNNLTVTADLAVTGDTTLNGNVTLGSDASDTVTVLGNFSVQGNTEIVNSTSLTIEDKFVLLASGSLTGDGGIIVQVGGVTGYGLGYESGIGRWVLDKDIAVDATTIAADEEWLGVVKSAAANPADATPPTYGGSSKGHGTIHVNSSTEEIWIYA